MSGEQFASVTVEEPPVTLVREASVRGGGVVVEYQLRTSSSTPTVVSIRQALPPGLGDVKFRPDAAPDDWVREDECIVAESTVPPGGRELVLGLALSDDAALPDGLPTPVLTLPGETAEEADEEDPATDGLDAQGADPATLEEAIRRVEAGEAPEPDLSARLSAGVDTPPEGEETVELTREELAQRNEQLMWLRAQATVAERERETLRETVEALRAALASVDGVDPETLPDPLDEE